MQVILELESFGLPFSRTPEVPFLNPRAGRSSVTDGGPDSWKKKKKYLCLYHMFFHLATMRPLEAPEGLRPLFRPGSQGKIYQRAFGGQSLKFGKGRGPKTAFLCRACLGVLAP